MLTDQYIVQSFSQVTKQNKTVLLGSHPLGHGLMLLHHPLTLRYNVWGSMSQFQHELVKKNCIWFKINPNKQGPFSWYFHQQLFCFRFSRDKNQRWKEQTELSQVSFHVLGSWSVHDVCSGVSACRKVICWKPGLLIITTEKQNGCCLVNSFKSPLSQCCFRFNKIIEWVLLLLLWACVLFFNGAVINRRLQQAALCTLSNAVTWTTEAELQWTEVITSAWKYWLNDWAFIGTKWDSFNK